MGWEERKGKPFYYAKTTANGRSCSTYMGNGPAAQLEAEGVEIEQAIREGKCQRLSSIREEGRELSEAYRNLDRCVRENVSAALTLEGYRCHARQWRPRRYPLEVSMRASPPKANTPASITFDRRNMVKVSMDETDGSEELSALIDRCGSAHPDVEDIALLRAWMERDGVMIRAEELARNVQLKALAYQENGFTEEATLVGVKDLMKRMGYDGADMVEQLLILQAGTAWLVLQRTDGNLQRITTGSYSLNEADACDKRVTRASNRFHRAVESLEKVRALRRMTEYRARARRLVKAEREALPRHSGDGAKQPVEDAEFAVVGA